MHGDQVVKEPAVLHTAPCFMGKSKRSSARSYDFF